MLKQFSEIETVFQQLFSVCGKLKNRIIELEDQLQKLTGQLKDIKQEEGIQAQRNELLREKIDGLLRRLEKIERKDSSGKEDFLQV